MKRERWTTAVLVGIIAVLGAVIVTDWIRPDARYVLAQETAAIPYLVALTGAERNLRVPLFLVDTRDQVVMAYEYNVSRRTLDLVRVRTFQWDRQLGDWNLGTTSGAGPTVEEVRAEVRRRATRGR